MTKKKNNIIESISLDSKTFKKTKFNDTNLVNIFNGKCEEFLDEFTDGSVQLIITSPPYNVGKEYENIMNFDEYLKWQDSIIEKCINKLADGGSICWQVGNYVEKNKSNEVFPLDIYLYDSFKKRGLKLRNRIVWHFGHGLHANNRFSGRYETILWFTKSDDYIFNLDEVRVPQKYPGKKHYKGSNAGTYSGNPLGKNPSDVWDIPNVKSNHIEKTEHPCQFPIALVRRLVLALSNQGDIVVDPFMGTGTTQCAAILEGRRTAGSEVLEKYYQIAKNRLELAISGDLRYREDKPIYQPKQGTNLTKNPFK
ncbi:MAG: site-specific DNA-methyltransferase [Clostridium sp.]|uniref:DNA-methyltransferase n=1 Tax=Clostridium TaxID=1485 RepID=UPI002902D6B0|nr:site-specific DNA-methyltransferase [Clostridium sp.]MDU1280012.1 site-specific DNA-methyltransferase [Clostridium sp.]MDU7089077.1 site-specific DNA-methyltransferase [Clostridium sp.]